MINRDFHVFWLFNQIVCLLNLNNILFPLTQLAFQNFSQNTHQTFNNTTRGTQLTTNYDQTKPLNRSSPPPITCWTQCTSIAYFWIYVPTSSITCTIYLSINRLLWIHPSRMWTKFSTIGVLIIYASILISSSFYLKCFLWSLAKVWYHCEHSTISI